jgi:transposase
MPRAEVEVLSIQRRQRFTAEEKRQFVEETLQPGTNIFLVARRHRISPSLLFRWRKLAQEGSLSAMHADELVVPISQVQALEQQIQLQRLLGKKT